MTNKINGICIDGKFYVEDNTDNDCEVCDLKEKCDAIWGEQIGFCAMLPDVTTSHFKFSQPLTDKLNKL